MASAASAPTASLPRKQAGKGEGLARAQRMGPGDLARAWPSEGGGAGGAQSSASLGAARGVGARASVGRLDTKRVLVVCPEAFEKWRGRAEGLWEK